MKLKQELISVTKWNTGGLNLGELLVLTIIKPALCFLPFNDSANCRSHSLFTKTNDYIH